ASAKRQPTSTAWRPPYHPQLGHTTWGSLARAHWGHTLRAGTASVQLLARRLRLLALEVFFLGTAMGLSALSARLLVGAQRVQRHPPRIGYLMLVGAGLSVQV